MILPGIDMIGAQIGISAPGHTKEPPSSPPHLRRGRLPPGSQHTWSKAKVAPSASPSTESCVWCVAPWTCVPHELAKEWGRMRHGLRGHARDQVIQNNVQELLNYRFMDLVPGNLML